jgi:hypothetical protein
VASGAIIISLKMQVKETVGVPPPEIIEELNI